MVRPRSIGPVLLLAACVASGSIHATLWKHAPFTVSDSPGYLEVARDLRDGRIDALHDRTPGYPLLLLATGSDSSPRRRLFTVQLLLHFAAVFFLAAALRRFGISVPLVAAVAGIALLPPSVASSALVLTESPTEFLLVTSVCGLILWLETGRRAWFAVANLSLALAVSVRPTYAFLGPCLGIPLALMASRAGERKRFRRAALSCTVIPSLLVGALVTDNARRFDFPGLTPLLGFNLSTRTVRFVERLPDEHAAVRRILLEHRDRELCHEDPAHTGQMYIWKARADLEKATGLKPAALSHTLLRWNLLLIRLAPLEYLREVALAMATYWFPATPEIALFGSPGLHGLWSLVHFVTMALFFTSGAILLGGAALALLLPSVRRVLPDLVPRFAPRLPGLALALTVIAYTFAVSTLVENGNPRYRSPTDLLLLAVIAIVWESCGELRHASRPFARPTPGGDSGPAGT